MTEEKFIELKNSHIDDIKKFVQKYGGFSPMITIFADQLEPQEGEEDKPAVIHIPIPPDYMANNEGKEEFLTNVLPEIFKTIKEKFVPECVIWTAEAWIRKAKRKVDNVEDINDIPISGEALIISTERKDSTKEFNVYNIKRVGQQVNDDGELVDQIELEEDQIDPGDESVQGRFSNLFKKFDV